MNKHAFDGFLETEPLGSVFCIGFRVEKSQENLENLNMPGRISTLVDNSQS